MEARAGKGGICLIQSAGVEKNLGVIEKPLSLNARENELSCSVEPNRVT